MQFEQVSVQNCFRRGTRGGKMLTFILRVLLFQVLSVIGFQNDEYILRTDRLPDDLNFMPTLGNGHLGFTVYGDAIFMNGLYNGLAGDSRRARIPNWLNISISSDTFTGKDVQQSYELKLEDGYFRSLHKVATGHGGTISVEQRSYAHRFYNRALVYELIVRRTNAEEAFTIHLNLNPGNASVALNFTEIGNQMLKGNTLVVEHERFQKETRSVFVVFSDDFKSEKLLEMKIGEKDLYYRHIITIDERRGVARKEMDDILATDSNNLLELHVNEWRNFWNEFSINVGGNIELIRTINAAIFYLANSLPSQSANQKNLHYFGLSPTGLGRGNIDADYEGHNFWDTEIWMLPVVSQLSTNWTKQLFEYRLQHLPGAEYNAQLTGFQGARFPWESAFTGTEVTNECCPEVAQYQIHISADIAFALQQFYAMINDREWLCNNAWHLLERIATFIVSRVEEDKVTGGYHIKDVMGPDEDHWNITDNVYTNVVFKVALKFASFTQKQCQAKTNNRNSIWEKISKGLVVLYDSHLDYHPEYLGYTLNEQIKQADVVLLGFPLQYPMNLTTQLNDLKFYENVTRASGPAMTWSMFAINNLDVGDIQKADFYFEKSFQSYVRQEFKVWSETIIGFHGSANFLTGIGGFLQAILAGYGGIRYHHRGENGNTMEIKKLRLLPNTNELSIKGIKFADAIFKLHATNERSSLTCIFLGKYKLKLHNGNERVLLQEGYKSAESFFGGSKSDKNQSSKIQEKSKLLSKFQSGKNN